MTSAAVCGLAAFLVLTRSTAIKRIDTLQYRTKHLYDDLARADLYALEIEDALRAVQQFRAERGYADPGPLISRTLGTAAVRCSAVLGSSVQFFVVRSTSVHVVRWAGGEDGFHRVGDRCPADRTLEEIASRLGSDHHIVSLMVEGAPHSMVVVADDRLTAAEHALARRLAIVLEFGVGNLRPPTSSHGVSLRAV